MKSLISRKVFGVINSIYEYIARDATHYANITSEKYRELIYKSYRIVYNVSDEINIIFIHSIIYGKRNFSSLKNSFI